LYLDVGLLDEALSILENAVEGWQYPMVYYLGAYLYQVVGQLDNAEQWREKARQCDPDRVFPSRLWEIIALEHALDQDQNDDKAKYFLGNFLYAHQRYDEAIELGGGSGRIEFFRCYSPGSGSRLLAAKR
jgi:tetratricopeptide (TPR) repeat protein